MTSFFGIKGAFFSKTTRWICANSGCKRKYLFITICIEKQCTRPLVHFADINCFENISKIASGLQTRWLHVVASIECRNHEPTFSNLMEFVKEEAQVVSSCYASALNRKSSKTSAVPKFNTHSTTVSKPSTGSHELCLYCLKGHNLWYCSSFARKRLPW